MSETNMISEKDKELLRKLEETLGYHFSNEILLNTALTHSSFANEQGGKGEHNERLEFLGDAALELCVSAELFIRFPDAREGDLTRMRAKIVSQPSLATLALACNLEGCLRLGKGEESQGGRDRPSLLSDALEAILGAVFLDGGFGAVQAVVGNILKGKWPEQEENNHSKDCKSLLQELTQRRYKERPVYTLVGSAGPEHAKTFTVQVTLPDSLVFMSDGPSLKRAEQLVACQALEYLLSNATPGSLLAAEDY